MAYSDEMNHTAPAAATANDTPPPSITRLADYTPPDFLIPNIELDIEITDAETIVTATLHFKRNPASEAVTSPVKLNGEHQRFISAHLDGALLDKNAYTLTPTHFILHNPPAAGTLRIQSANRPQDNTALEGLYQAGEALCTQCEAEGFRRITYFPDRPDILSIFKVRISADIARYPILLSNGNLMQAETQADGRHSVSWEDPFPKPCYLFALVAGRLGVVEDHFITRSGRRVLLQIYVEPGNEDQCGHAMQALKNSMRWDEEVFGLEYDLDRFMIVAVSFFNMGAMENKGLNIFNDRYILARPDVATDADFMNIEAVVAHEYFHNWTGNRVTCRDWFQLSLKEGLTVFRDQEFSSDMNSRAVERITNVRNLRAYQFVEDAGPNAHPIRPSQYITIDNFYTATVYEKGAEIIRMLHTLLGADGFRRGMDLYFKRHDGQAVRCEDFVAAMGDANQFATEHFSLWYAQAGTPRLKIASQFNANDKTYTLHCSQLVPSTPDMAEKNAPTERVVCVEAAEQSFTFHNIAEAPIPSLLRDFSAPVIMDYAYSETDLTFLCANDQDPFNRWEAAQRLATKHLLALVASLQNAEPLVAPQNFINAMAKTLEADLDPAFKALCLSLPSESELAQRLVETEKTIDVVAIHQARRFLRQQISFSLKAALKLQHQALEADDPADISGKAAGRRALKNLCLGYLGIQTEEDGITKKLMAQTQSTSMTDVVAALSILSERNSEEREKAFSHFYNQWQKEPLVLDKWFALQAQSSRPDALEQVRRLLAHPAFDIKNPNKVRSLIGAFALGNQLHFNAADGSGYEFLAEQIAILDPLNPQIAARLLSAFSRWRHYSPVLQEKMRAAMEKILALPSLSPNSYEIVSKTLAAV